MNANKDSIVVKLNVGASDWEQAVIAAGDMLTKHGYAEPRYTTAMIEMVKEKGPYIVLTKGVALPHARPEDGALSTGLSLLVLKEPVCFGHPQNDPVKVVIALSSIDNQSHIQMLSRLAKVLACKEAITMISQAQTCQEVYEILERGCEK